MSDELSEIRDRLKEVELSLDAKVDQLQFWKIIGPAILLGAVALASLGYFDFTRIPERVETRVSAELVDQLPDKISDILPDAAKEEVTARIPEIAEPIIRTRVGELVEDELKIVPEAAADAVELELNRLFGTQYSQVVRQLAGISVGEVQFPHKRRPASGEVSNWTLLDEEQVVFDRKYDHPPNVFISVTGIEIYRQANNANTPLFRVQVSNKTSTGFKLLLYGAYTSSFSNATVQWLAIDRVFQNAATNSE